ncbi:hypothetical protein FJTKL_11676 [Diaporthe vaccinii]|uniref:Uncharacterized protein n=1 Tax=Diaporthe vaccinii TaxID=105482 RepID=A0ABR4EG23_9PEZI
MSFYNTWSHTRAKLIYYGNTLKKLRAVKGRRKRSGHAQKKVAQAKSQGEETLSGIASLITHGKWGVTIAMGHSKQQACLHVINVGRKLQKKRRSSPVKTSCYRN